MQSPTNEAAEFRVAKFELERTIAHPIERVWQALTDEVHAWWPRDFMVNPDGVAFRLDVKLGGVFGEDWGDGQGLVWAIVNELRRPYLAGSSDSGDNAEGTRARLGLSGELMPDFGGPARTQHVFILESTKPDTTQLQFQDCVYGAVSESTAASLKDGWALILDAFVAHLAA